MSLSQRIIFVAGLAVITVALLFPFLKTPVFDKGMGYYFLLSGPVMDAIFGERPEYRYPPARNLLPSLFIALGIAVIAIRRKFSPDSSQSPALRRRSGTESAPGQPPGSEK